MKILRITGEDWNNLQKGKVLQLDMYVIYWTEWGWDYAIQPNDAEYFDKEIDGLVEFMDLYSECTEIVDYDEEEESDD